MYTFFHHRKLINDSVEDPFIKLCQPYCDPLNNQDGFCPIPCLTRCYPTCNNSIILIDTPPPPPISISYDDDPQVRSHKLSIFFTLSLAVLAATFLLFSIYTAYKFYQRRFVLRRNQSNPPQGQRQEEVPIVREFFVDQDIGSVVDHPIWYIRTVGLQPAVISSIGTVKYKRGDGLVEGTDCSVCLNEFQEDEILRLLPKCEHAFHIACIDTWLRSHTNCPLCRAPIVITTAANSQSSDQRARARSLSNVVESQIQENRESEEREVEIEVPQSRVEIDLRDSREDDGISGSEENGVHFLRRSVSMDSLAASAISAAIANAVQLRSERNFDKQSVEMMTSTGSSSPKQAVDSSQKDLNSVCSSSNEPKGPSFMVKRSLSCSAKVFLSRYSRSKSSTPPPPPPLPPAPLP